MKKLIGILVLIFLFAAALGCGSDHKTMPANQFVAFLTQVSSGSSTYQINVMKNDGSSVTAVGTPDKFSSVRLSPDGKKVVFGYYDSTNNWQIGIMNANSSGSGRTALTTSGHSYSPQFTPDGSKIIYESYPDIYEMSVDGTHSQNLTNQNGNAYVYATVSPDGKTIAAYVYNGPLGIGLATLNADGSGATTVILPGYYYWPSFSSDGTKIFVHNYQSGVGTSVSVVDVDGKNLTPLASGLYNACPIVVGSKVLFQSTRDSTTSQIYNMNPDGGSITQLTSGTVYDGFVGYGQE